MAEKRMFTQKIIDSDAFLDMPLSAQALYFHLNMRADDDGFVNNPRKIARYINASDDDLKILLMKRFVIGFESGVIVIKHWRMHNTIKSDRYHGTQYQEELAMLMMKDNKSYTEVKPAAPALPVHEPVVFEVPAEKPAAKQKRSSYSVPFEKFWSAYPRKIDKGNAYKKYQARLHDGYSDEQLITAARNYAAECSKLRTQKEYIKHPKTFLSDALPFLDYLPKDQEKKQPTSDNPYAMWEEEADGQNS